MLAFSLNTQRITANNFIIYWIFIEKGEFCSLRSLCFGLICLQQIKITTRKNRLN